MGMDLYVYAREKGLPYEYDEELCYARKFWGLWDCLKTEPTEVQEQILDKNKWYALMDNIGKHIDLLHEVEAIYDKYFFDRNFMAARDEMKKINKYEKWYNDTFCETPVLGYDFDLHAIIEWYEKRETVNNYLEDDDYCVYIYCSY